MKNKYISPSTKVVTIVVGKHFMAESFNLYQGENDKKEFGSTLSRKDNSSWDDEE